jgi:cobalt-precorrin 5A hydrolase
MDADQVLIAAGLGFGRRAAALSLCAALEAAAARAGARPALLAIPAFKAERAEAAREAAARLGLPLRLIPRPALLRVQPLTASRSEKARQAVGLASVAEAAALAALAAGARLLLPKWVHDGVTVALAIGAPASDEGDPP